MPAYSTLGKFNDPILNTMMIYGDDELASIMFHELSHQLVYIQDDTSFNEAFAVTVEQEGLARWLKFRGREADLAKYQKRRTRQAEGVALVAQFRGELTRVVRHELRAGSHACAQGAGVCAAGHPSCARSTSGSARSRRLAAELDGKPNNARLASLATYYDCVPGFERLLADEQHDLPRFYAAARALAKLPREERRARAVPDLQSGARVRINAVRVPQPRPQAELRIFCALCQVDEFRVQARFARVIIGRKASCATYSGRDPNRFSMRRAANGSSPSSHGCCATAAAIRNFSIPRWCCRSRNTFPTAA